MVTTFGNGYSNTSTKPGRGCLQRERERERERERKRERERDEQIGTQRVGKG